MDPFAESSSRLGPLPTHRAGPSDTFHQPGSLPDDWEETLLEPEDPTAPDVPVDLLEQEFTSEKSYYAILNVSKQASDDEIRESYRRLCLAFHPDKHRDPLAHQAARIQFERIQRAYEVLSQPKLRALYDELGEEGLSLAKDDTVDEKDTDVVFETWTVGQRLKTREEIREEMERRILHTRQSTLHHLIKSKGTIELYVNAAPALDGTGGYGLDDETSKYQGFRKLLAKEEAEEVEADGDHGKHIPNVKVVRDQGRYTLGDSVQLLTTPVQGAKQWIESLELLRFQVRHAFDLPISDKTSATIQGQLTASKERGEGNLTATIKHHHNSNLYSECRFSLFKPHLAMVKTHYQIGPAGYATLVATSSRLGRPPAFTLTTGRALSPGFTMYSTLKTGPWWVGTWGRPQVSGIGGRHRLMEPQSRFPASAMAVGFAKQMTLSHITGELQAGLRASHVSVTYGRKLDTGVDFQGSLTLSNSAGLICSVGTNNQVTKHTKLGWFVQFGFPTGVNVQLKFTRLGQTIHLPVVLSTAPSLKTLAFACMAPVVTTAVVNQLFVKPHRQQRLRAKIEFLREEFKETLSTRRAEADTTRAALQTQADKKRKGEEKVDGLVILEAWYGKLTGSSVVDTKTSDVSSSALGHVAQRHFPLALKNALNVVPLQLFTTPKAATTAGDEEAVIGDDNYLFASGTQQSEPQLVDVTVVLQTMVNDSKLLILGGVSKADLIGFYDPCFGEPKQLQVTYLFNRRMHSVVVDDRAPLACPLKCKYWHRYP
ncbi:hypothetical protein IWQ61_008374 [Dispira simplex]|nr:hypothetical protein IWQ61_008374 [Dispira simplex]